MKRSRIKRRARTKHQLANVEHREYLAWIHTQRCCGCGGDFLPEAIQAAHVGRGGMGMKHGSDAETIPLCGPGANDCHADHDQRRAGFSSEFMTREQLRAWDAHQVAVHRGRFEARATGTFEEVPF